MVTVFAFLNAAIVCNYRGDNWEEYVRNGLYKLKGDSIPSYATEFVDSNGLPYVYYATENGISPGYQYNATIVCNYALHYYDSLQQHNDVAVRHRFDNCLAWLAKNLTYRGNYALYVFNWQQPWYDSVKAPFTSGMTSGLAIEVFTDAFRLTKDSTWLKHAKAVLNGFFVPINQGGFTFFEPEGWWYEEIADTNMHTPRILDGHIFAVLGVNKFYLLTKDDSVLLVVNNGLKALKHVLPGCDAGNGAIYYDKYHKPADKKYKRIITNQLKRLHEATGDSIYNTYYEKWTAPMRKPYVFRIIKERNISGIILYLMVAAIFTGLLLMFSKIFAAKKKNGPL